MPLVGLGVLPYINFTHFLVYVKYSSRGIITYYFHIVFIEDSKSQRMKLLATFFCIHIDSFNINAIHIYI